MHPLRPIHPALAASALGLSLLLAACAGPATSPAAGTLLPNENLHVEGLPPIPMALVARADRYTDFRGHGFVDWHPTRPEMLVSHRQAGGSTAQLFRVAGPLAAPEALTDFADPVTSASYEPRDGRYIVFARSSGGNEAHQLYRLDPATRSTTLLTHPDERHEALAWLRGRSELIYSAVPLDRTAAGGTRADPGTTLWIVDPLRPESRRKLAELPGTGWLGGDVSRDDRQLAITRYRSVNESEVWLIDLANGTPTQLLPAAGETLKATHKPVAFQPDGRGLFVFSDRAGEFVELMRYDLDQRTLQRVTGHIPWDVGAVGLSGDGHRLAVQVNVDGRQELRLFDARTLAEQPLPALPPGSAGQPSFHPRLGTLAITIDSSREPGRIRALDADGRWQAWTQAYIPAAVDTRAFPDQGIVRWTSFDGLAMSAILTPPPARFTGRRPVVVRVHGGPESQATMGFLGRWSYLVNELGIAMIEPNVRGSAGYGKTFLTLDNGMKREDSVKDLGSLFDWIATQPGLDPSRVLVVGGSYGGYMSLAASVHYADRIAGAIDVVGISSFTTFLANTESYRRDLRRVEYGDEREPAMREFLDRISPLNNAQRITRPLFVVQGRNDPRVPWTEAEQIVKKVRENGTPVWYLRAENEGHGFRRKENADFQFYAMLRFMEQTLLK
ncbi:prolyl oligopeptidase family serine peptidase [uncultured Methylibium sp.]|uniref:S9 family peptidase n=1 Tax=uncultured Methylibium sp. TaxID=381093 RepID=UPI0025EC6211|nr:prolyl oligopeptidase family serine peptidase [uncultured Methylibium sp.]